MTDQPISLASENLARIQMFMSEVEVLAFLLTVTDTLEFFQTWHPWDWTRA
jgi:hypothetical protein